MTLQLLQLDDLRKSLVQTCQYKPIRDEPFQFQNLSFTAGFMRNDPMQLLIVEAVPDAKAPTLKTLFDKTQTLVWSLHANGKRNMLTMILLFEDRTSRETAAPTLAKFEGAASLFTLDKEMTPAEVESEIFPLKAIPLSSHAAGHTTDNRLLEQLSEGKTEQVRTDAAELLEATRGSKSPDDASSKLLALYQERIAGVENAAAESDSQ